MWSSFFGAALLFTDNQKQVQPEMPPLNLLAQLGKVTIELPDGQIITAEKLADNKQGDGDE